MKTVTVNLGGKTYLAAELTSSEFSEVARITAAMVSAARSRDLSKATGVVRSLAEKHQSARAPEEAASALTEQPD